MILAAAWRERAAAGNTYGVTVERRADKLTVRVSDAAVGTFRVTYQAHAYAEHLARQREARQGG